MTKTILITGASSGIGRATSLYFAQQGWNVIATMRTPEKETELTKMANILVTALEVTKPETIKAAIEKGIEQFGHIDALLNNAGYGQQGLFEAVTADKIQEQFDVNVFGVMNVTRAILPYLRKQQTESVIVNITSGVGKIPFPMTSIYTASKYAIEGYTEALAYELDSQNIKVKIIEPGYVQTNFQERAGEEFAIDDSLTDYKEFLEVTNQLLGNLSSAEIFTANDVAATIFRAVTDGTQQLRYVAGSDIEQMINTRKEKTEQEYVEYLRGLFAPQGFNNKKQ
ncbi:SDR family oxidoreductase [Myroides marinus]|uniref:SDR family oxidoreductase n=1 Tax=Myroides marinus TaxID=703342 RepID=UPI0025764B3D|nr:SDR family oxidoreductase [Myroides marinus]MDM1362643.1 SDR family oxidoreductase [Myroides marinus]